MKKILVCVCLFVILTACCLPVAAASMVPDEETAKEHGFTIMYYRINGWNTPYCYLDENKRIPNRISIETNEKLDISQYVYGEVNDFYGLEVFDVDDVFCTLVDKFGPLEDYGIYKCMYSITTVNFLSDEELEAWASEYDFITKAYFDGIMDPAEDVEPEPEIKGDVNRDGAFDTMDYVLMKRAYFGTYPEKNLYCDKGDLNGNRKIDSMDYTLLKRAYFGTYEIK